MFEANVEHSTLDSSAKLTSLMQYFVGYAKQVIMCCAALDLAAETKV